MAPDLDLDLGAPGDPQVNTESGEWGDPLDELAIDDAPHVSPDTVRGVLAAIGAGVCVVAHDPDLPDQWRFTPRELDDLTPPVTNIINSRPALRRAVARGDYAVVAMHLAGYAGRNLGAGKRAKELRGDDINREGIDGMGAGTPLVGHPDGHTVGGNGGGVHSGGLGGHEPR